MTNLCLAPGAGFQIESEEDLDRYVAAVSAAGFQGVSLSLGQVEPFIASVPAVLARYRLCCPEVLSLAITRNDEEVLGAANRLAHLAEAVQADFALSLFYTRVNEESLDRFGRSADIIVASGSKLAIEMPPIGELNSIADALAVVDAVGRDRSCLLIDTFHFSRGRSTWEQLETFPTEALGYVQFDDALPAIGEDVMLETRDRRTMPGDGEFELHRFCDVLNRRGWSGWVSVEVLSADLRQLDVEEFASRAYRSSAPYWER